MFEFLELHFSLLLIAAGKAKTFDANEKRLHYFFLRELIGQQVWFQNQPTDNTEREYAEWRPRF